jgi:hypothetical protein
MKITCPKNPKHNRFSATAHVMQEWLVDETGEFVRVLNDCLEVDSGPEVGNEFICTCKTKGKVCGAEAIVKSI